MNLISRLLRKNTSPARIAGFVLSNFIGLAIVAGGLQFFIDARSLFSSDDSFVKSDFLVVNKKVTGSNMWDDAKSGFSPEEIADIRRQPWVRDVGEFKSNDYRVMASVGQGGRGMSTLLFFESIPDEFVDNAGSRWHYREGDTSVPIIISKDYLALYNFGFAGSAGLPQITENVLASIPLQLTLSSDDGGRTRRLTGRVVGLSNRLNTILVPQDFMDWSNRELGSGDEGMSSRLVIDVSSPGDIAIKDYLESHDLEVAGDKSNSSASFLLKVVMGIVMAVGIVITLLSFFILLLSMSLLMEKNRDKLHTLLMLGWEPCKIAAPYFRIVALSVIVAFLLACVSVLLMRAYYLTPLSGLGAHPAGWWYGIGVAFLFSLFIMGMNFVAVTRKIRSSWR